MYNLCDDFIKGKNMMLYNQDAVVSSSQDSLLETMPCTGTTETIGVMTGRRPVLPQLKIPKVAKVFPFRKEEDKSGPEKTPKEKIKPTKKQHFPWMHKFNNICRESLGCQDYNKLDNLMEIFIRYVSEDVNNCYKKPNRASKLKNRMGSYLRFFHSLYRSTRKPLEIDHYKDKMSSLLAMYLDMEIKASRRGRELPKVISERLTSSLFVLLDDSKEHILNSILSAKFFRKHFNDICIPIIRSVVRDIPKQMDKKTYFQYIYICKKWKLLLKHSDISEVKKVTSKLVPPLEVILESEKLYGISSSSGKTAQESICMKYMRDPKFKFKQKTKCSTNTKGRKSLEDMETVSSLFSEDKYYYNKKSPTSDKKFAMYLRNIWHEWNDLTGSSVEYDPTVPLYEESEIYEQSIGESQIFEKNRIDITRNPIIKDKECEKWQQPIQTSIGCITNSNSINSVQRCLSYSANEDFVKIEYIHNRDCSQLNEINVINKIKTSTTSKMEADSQSQDEVIVITDDDDEEEEEFLSGVKIELKEKDDVDKNRRENPVEKIQYPVLRVKPGGRTENIEKFSIIENSSLEAAQSAQEVQIVSTECVQPFNLDQASTQIEPEPNECNTKVENVVNPAKELIAIEANSHSTVDTDQPSPISDSKTNNDLLLDDICKEDAVQEVPPQLWSNDQPFEDMFDPNDPTTGLVFYPDGTGNSWTHDVILGQHDDDLLYQYECGNTNNYPEFYNDQPDIMFSGVDIFEIMKEDPMLSNTLENLMGDVTYNEKTNTSPERESTSQISGEESVAVEYCEKKRGRRRRSATKVHSNSPIKTVDISTEQNSKEIASEEDSNKVEKELHSLKRRKSARFMSEEEADNSKEKVEQKTKKRKTQTKKTTDDKLIAAVSAKSSALVNSKKQQKNNQPPATRKKTQRRRR